jgi:hypothetical protein
MIRSSRNVRRCGSSRKRFDRNDCLVDDHVIPPQPRRSKKLSDAELICLAVAQVLLGARSEHHWLRMYYGRLGHLFPYLPKQPGYHQRGKTCTPLICQTTLHLATLFPDRRAAPAGRHPGCRAAPPDPPWRQTRRSGAPGGGAGGARPLPRRQELS